jgi:hypothetical protein
MNKDKFEVGDLVTSKLLGTDGIGLVVSVSTIRTVTVYWFKHAETHQAHRDHHTKLSETQEE